MKHLDRVPLGFSRKRKGWLLADATPQAATIARLEKKNKILQDKLAAIEATLELLVKTKEICG
jgi:hypothetical protein